MEEISHQIDDLNSQLQKALKKLNLDQLDQELIKLDQNSQEPDFWSNQNEAQSVMKRIDEIKNRLKTWRDFQNNLNDLEELAKLKDDSLLDELSRNLAISQKQFDQLSKQLKFDQPYDDHDVIMSIFAGAGGVDAQDWTAMLFRMYTRFFEIKHYQFNIISQTIGDEAGLKSVSIEVQGQQIYGNLRSEDGVHRLVRLSPFNADHLRQTSFAKVEIMPKIRFNDEIDLNDKDLRVDVFRSGGHGGQSVNTTDSAVRITHLPTGITVSMQNERSQLQNKQLALEIIKSRLLKLKIDQHVKDLNQIKGPNISAEWGNQIRNYILHPYKLVKDVRTKYEDNDVEAVLDGHIQAFIDSYLDSYGVK